MSTTEWVHLCVDCTVSRGWLIVLRHPLEGVRTLRLCQGCLEARTQDGELPQDLEDWEAARSEWQDTQRVDRVTERND
jgi:hypothetical protein